MHRILCVITQGEIGGAQRFVGQLAENLDSNQFAVHVIWGKHTGDKIAHLLPSHVTWSTIKHLVRNPSPINDLLAVGELANQFRTRKPDSILLISSKAGFVGSLAARRVRSALPNTKVIYRIGGWTFNDPWHPWRGHLYRWMERFSARFKDVIVVNSRHDLLQAEQFGIHPRRKILCIHNGIDPFLPLPSQREAKMALQAHLGVPLGNDPVVGTIANFYPAKDLGVFIRAAARMANNVQFVIIGSGPLHKDLVSLVNKCGLQRRLHFAGSISRAWEFLPAFNAFALSSKKEGFPWALLEAMTARLAVVATSVGAVPEMIDSGVSGLIVPSEDPSALADALGLIIRDPIRAQKLGIAAHQRVLEQFSVQQMVGRYTKLFLE